jgi:hypothetical protein
MESSGMHRQRKTRHAFKHAGFMDVSGMLEVGAIESLPVIRMSV